MSFKVLSLRVVLVGTLAFAAPAAAHAQQSALRVSVAQENFRAAPGGTQIAVVMENAVLAAGEDRQQWREATLDAWVREDAVVPTTRDGHDLAIRSNGTTLHAGREGDVVARGLQGFLLDEVSRSDGWVRVTRTGWIWSASVTDAAGRGAPTARAGAAATPPPSTPAPRTTRTMHASPAGPQTGTLGPDASYEVVGEEGEWRRVRVEGWIRAPAGSEADPAGPLQSLSLRTLRENPDAYRGRSVAWRVQFVAVQRADSLRTDLVAGESYILARDPGGEPGYVYIAVPAALLPAAQRLIPLQQVEVVGRVRTGRSEIMGHPVLDLIELRPGQ